MTVARPETRGGLVSSARQARGQLILCQGCCCGRADRGFPEVPVERIKAAWKSGRLNRTIQLTVSGCVGPCDVANVAVVVGPAGTSWFGSLDVIHYDILIKWAQDCHSASILLPLPPGLQEHRFEWFHAEPQSATPPACSSEGGPTTEVAPTRRERP
jgi:hypothetical protein